MDNGTGYTYNRALVSRSQKRLDSPVISIISEIFVDNVTEYSKQDSIHRLSPLLVKYLWITGRDSNSICRVWTRYSVWLETGWRRPFYFWDFTLELQSWVQTFEFSTRVINSILQSKLECHLHIHTRTLVESFSRSRILTTNFHGKYFKNTPSLNVQVYRTYGYLPSMYFIYKLSVCFYVTGVISSN